MDSTSPSPQHPAGSQQPPRPRPQRPRPTPLGAPVAAESVAVESAAEAEPRLPQSIRVPSLLATLRRSSTAAPGSTAGVARGASIGAIAVGAALFAVACLTGPVVAENVSEKTTPTPSSSGTGSTPLIAPIVAGSTATPAPAVAAPRPKAAPKAPADPGAISALAGNGIPKVALNAYRVAAARVDHSDPSCAIHWSLLAGIGRVESDHGRFAGSSLRADGTSTPPIVGPALTGTTWEFFPAAPQYIAVTGDSKYAHALGPMQFIPSTWQGWGSDANGDGKADIFNVNDAALAAARYLCAAGGNLGTQTGRVRAVLAYNHNDQYLAQVLALADAYKRGVPVSGIPVGNITGSLPSIGHTGDLPPVNPAAPTASDKTAKKPTKKATTPTKPGQSGKSGGTGSGGSTKPGGSGGSGSGSGSGSSGGSGGSGSGSGGSGSGSGSGGSGGSSGGGSGSGGSGGTTPGGGSGLPTTPDPTPTTSAPSSCALVNLGDVCI